MSLARVHWTLGHDRARTSRRRGLRERRATVAALSGRLISLVAVLGRPVKDPDGRTVGRLDDVLVRWGAGSAYPAVTAIVLKVGRLRVVVDGSAVTGTPPATVALRAPAAEVRALARHAGDVALRRDVLDHQIVDADGTDVLRPADVYLAVVDGRVELAGIEVGAGVLLRRLGPAWLRRSAHPSRAIDWADMRGFAPVRARGAAAPRDPAALAGEVRANLQLGRNLADIARLGPDDIAAMLDRKTGER